MACPIVTDGPRSANGPLMQSSSKHQEVRSMRRSNTHALAIFSAIIALLAGVASAIGVFARGDGSTILATSVRGTTYEVAANGVYAFNAQRVVAEGVGWDIFTLAIAVPALILASVAIWRGWYAGLLFGAGLIGYFVYLYLEYSVTWAFGPLFPLFVLLMALSLLALIWFAAAIARGRPATQIGRGFPRVGWAALSGAMSVVLSLMWTGRILQGLNGGADELLLGETTMTVQALDLGVMVPISLLIIALVWRRSQVGYLAAAAFSVTFVAMSAAIASMLLTDGVVEGAFELPPIAIFGVAAAAGVL